MSDRSRSQNLNNVLFDYVLLISLEKTEGLSKPFVEYRFPPVLQENKFKQNDLTNTIVQFCFPEAEDWIKSKLVSEKRSENFSFVLTEGDGAKKFGYCRRFVLKNSGIRGDLVPKCFCILSFVPCASIFYKILDIVEELLNNKNSSTAFSFLKSVLAKEFPNPGDVLLIRTFDGVSYELKRSDNDFLLDFVTFRTLFKNVDVSIILDLFTAVLMESRIIICS